jgi:hypothetical protein
MRKKNISSKKYHIFTKDLLRHVDELELSVRSANYLKNAGINFIGELVQKTEAEMLVSKNFSRKSLNEIKEVLVEMGLSFGMDLRSQRPFGEESKNKVGEFNKEFWAISFLGGKLRLMYLSEDERGYQYFYIDKLDMYGGLHVVSSETIALKHAINELEDMLNNPNTKEGDLQDFFERYPSFIINDEHKHAHPKVVLENSQNESLIPDFILEPFSQTSMCDILDIKSPNLKVWILKKNRHRFSSAVLEACAQLRQYSNYFEEEENRLNILNRYGLLAYKPKLFVIIGRKGEIDLIIKKQIELTIPDVTIQTYDDIISKMKRKIS